MTSQSLDFLTCKMEIVTSWDVVRIRRLLHVKSWAWFSANVIAVITLLSFITTFSSNSVLGDCQSTEIISW